jgi:hypothetical protein
MPAGGGLQGAHDVGDVAVRHLAEKRMGHVLAAISRRHVMARLFSPKDPHDLVV